jgi:hypothetical protein
MSMLKLKLIGAASLLLGAVACEPLPVYPQTDGPRRPYPPQPYNQNDQRPPYYGDQGNNPPNYNQPNYNQPYGTQPAPPPGPTPPPRDQYPTAERTDNPNRVLSPYAPYNVIDVQGFRSGQLAKDPSNGKIFRVP